MDKLVYDQLTVALKRRGGGFPAIQCDDFYGLMDTIFTEEEAKVAALLPDTPVSADMLADQVKGNPPQVRQLLEGMAGKGILFSTAYDSKRYYVMLPLIPGIIENQLLTGVVNDRARHISLVTCHCRHMYELLGDPCDKPKDVCMAIGPGALYMSEYGLGKLILQRRGLRRA
jgi:hypothetical protein